MMEVMPRSGARVLGLEVRGRITLAQLGSAVERFESILAERGAVRLLVRIDRIPGFDLDALVDRLRFGLRDARYIERVAVVSDALWLERYVRVARLLVPRIEIHRFDVDELDTAWRWLETEETSLTAVP